jgi:hypothetical protein
MTFTVLTVDNGNVYAIGSDGNVYRWNQSAWTMYAQVVA